ncbi:hypothetical protein D9M68_984150 [compost metagenome]
MLDLIHHEKADRMQGGDLGHGNNQLVDASSFFDVPLEVLRSEQAIHRFEEVDAQLLWTASVGAFQSQPDDLDHAGESAMLDALGVVA